MSEQDKRQSIGNNIRLLRSSRGLSARALAARVGITPSYLSKLERGLARLSVDLVQRISAEMQVAPGDLLTPGLKVAANGSPVSVNTAVSLIRADERRILRLPKYPYDLELLTPYGRGQLEVNWVELAPGVGDPAPKSHDNSEECLLLLKGILHVIVADQLYVLNPGDCITYHSRTPHLVRNPGRERAVWVWIATPPEL